MPTMPAAAVLMLSMLVPSPNLPSASSILSKMPTSASMDAAIMVDMNASCNSTLLHSSRWRDWNTLEAMYASATIRYARVSAMGTPRDSTLVANDGSAILHISTQTHIKIKSNPPAGKHTYKNHNAK